MQLVVPQSNYNSIIKDHWWQIPTTRTITMKKFAMKYCKNSHNMTERNAVRKMVLTDMFNAESPQTFNLWKIQYLLSAIKRGMSVLLVYHFVLAPSNSPSSLMPTSFPLTTTSWPHTAHSVSFILSLNSLSWEFHIYQKVSSPIRKKNMIQL